MGERLLCKQEVIGSIPFTSTVLMVWQVGFTTRQEVSFAIRAPLVPVCGFVD